MYYIYAYILHIYIYMYMSYMSCMSSMSYIHLISLLYGAFCARPLAHRGATGASAAAAALGAGGRGGEGPRADDQQAGLEREAGGAISDLFWADFGPISGHFGPIFAWFLGAPAALELRMVHVLHATRHARGAEGPRSERHSTKRLRNGAFPLPRTPRSVPWQRNLGLRGYS